MLVNVGRGESSAAEAGLGGGGAGFASHLCKELYTNIQHALLPLSEVQRIGLWADASAADLSSSGLLDYWI